MAIIDSLNEHNGSSKINTVTISKEEYDELREDSIKLEIFLDAMFSKARLNYSNTDLTFTNIDEIMPILFPASYDITFDNLKAMQLEKVRKAEEQAKDE